MAKFFRSLEFESRNPEISQTWEGIKTFNFIKIAKSVFDQNFRQLPKLDDAWMTEVIEELKAQNHEGCLRYLKSALVEGNLIALLQANFAEFQDASFLVNRKTLEKWISDELDTVATNSGDDRSSFSHPMLYWVVGYLKLTLDPEYHDRKRQNLPYF